MKENDPTRAQRVNHLEKEYMKQGETERNSFARAVTANYIFETLGVSMDHARAFEKVVAKAKYTRLANGLKKLRDERAAEQFDPTHE